MHDVGARALDSRASVSTPRLQASRKRPACACRDGDERGAILPLRHRLRGRGRRRNNDDVNSSLAELRHEPLSRHLWTAHGLLPGCGEVGEHRDAD